MLDGLPDPEVQEPIEWDVLTTDGLARVTAPDVEVAKEKALEAFPSSALVWWLEKEKSPLKTVDSLAPGRFKVIV